MFQFLADQNFNWKIIEGLLRRTAHAHIIATRQVGLARASDPTLLAWAVSNGCLILSHDTNTLIGYAYERVKTGQPTPGLFAVPQDLPIGRAIEDLLMIVECSEQGEWEGQVHYLPL